MPIVLLNCITVLAFCMSPEPTRIALYYNAALFIIQGY